MVRLRSGERRVTGALNMFACLPACFFFCFVLFFASVHACIACLPALLLACLACLLACMLARLSVCLLADWLACWLTRLVKKFKRRYFGSAFLQRRQLICLFRAEFSRACTARHLRKMVRKFRPPLFSFLFFFNCLPDSWLSLLHGFPTFVAS